MTILYTGLNPPSDPHIVHLPFIQIVPTSPPPELKTEVEKATHLIFTSKSAVEQFFSLPYAIAHLPCYAVGASTKKALEAKGVKMVFTPKIETAEGLIELIENESFSKPHFIWPHSALSRNVIPHFLKEKGWSFYECSIYNTLLTPPNPLPPLDQFEEIIFTSPSTVDSFFHAYGYFPTINLTSIGPITGKRLDDLQRT